MNSNCTEEINYHMLDSLKCKGCCSGGNLIPPRDENRAYFSQDVDRCERSKTNENHQFPVGICPCCKDPPCQPFPKSCQNFGRPVLVYEIPSPKFEGTTTHQRDFVPKPVPVKEMPPWHPNLKDRWKSLDVQSFNKSTYQSDFTPQVATQECPKPVYLAPRGKKDRCQELSETFQTWRKTSKGPSHTHEVCDKPIIMETAIVCKKTVPSEEHHQHEDPCNKRSENNQLHGPECEKHCFSAPLMCHVKSQNSHGDEHHAYCHADGNILNQVACNTSQYSRVENDLPKKATNEPHYHTGLSDFQGIEIYPSQKVRNCSAQQNLHYEDSKGDQNNGLGQPEFTNRHTCDDYPRHSINHPETTCVTMNHPAGDSCGYFRTKEQQQHLAKEYGKDISHSRSRKHVHFKPEPDICCDPDISISEKYQSAHDTQNFKKYSCPTPRPTTSSNNFTLCEDATNNQPKCWWKRTSCEPQRNHLEFADVPRDVTKPSCPSYLTIHKRDYTQPCLENYRQSNEDNKALSPECGCTGNITEKFLCPEFERGGLI